MKGAAQLFSSARVKAKPSRGGTPTKVSSDLWQTPQHLLDRVRQVGPIELDVATSSRNPVRAERFYTEKDDGLTQEWNTRPDAIAWCNFPYSNALRWLSFAALGWQGRPWNGNVIVLGPARTDTLAWHKYVWPYAARICFLRGRLVFDVPPCKGLGHRWVFGVKRNVCDRCGVEKPTSAPFPSALIIYTHNERVAERFGEVFVDAGRVVRL